MTRPIRVALLAAALAIAPVAAQQQPTFKSGSGAIVSIFATVSDVERRLVPGLEIDDFEILDNEQPQPIVLFDNKVQPITVVVILDTSLSMTNSIALLRQAAEQFVLRLLPADKAKVGAFNDKIEFSSRFTNNRDELITDVKDLDYGNGTRLWDAVNASLDELKGVEGRRVILVFTDGDDTASKVGLGRVTDRARDEDVMVYSVGLESEFFDGQRMPIRFRLLNESDVRSVLGMHDLVEAMESALARFSSGKVDQPARTVVQIAPDGFLWSMPALAREPAALGAKLVTLVGSNPAHGMPSHLATILLLDPQTGGLTALLDGRYITEARTAAVSAVSSKLLARPTSKALAIIGSGVQARSHLEALAHVHAFKQITVWSPNQSRRDEFAAEARDAGFAGFQKGSAPQIGAVDHAGEAVVGADIIVLVTSSPTPVLESGWVKPGAHIICVGACRPNQREIDPVLTARSRLFVDSRAAALVESGDVVMIIISVKPNNRNRSPVIAYWIPIVLWSWEKTYFCQKPSS